MASFFVNRPIVAIVISIIMTIVGVATFWACRLRSSRISSRRKSR